ncbi:AEC family transporter [bacterium]|nr:AEC family transporter [bacterium]
MVIAKLIFAINFPILLGYFFYLIGVFSEDDIPVLRRFVIKVTVPFIIFVNLVKADVELMHQIIPSVTAFIIMTVLFTTVSILLAPLVSRDKKDSNGFCIGTFVGNYGYLGWGVAFYFYGDAGFSRSVFFSMLFWPAFLLSGFIMTSIRSKTDSRFPWKKLAQLMMENGLIPIVVLIIALSMSAGNIQLPDFIMKSMKSIAALTVPVILFTVGLSFRLKIEKSKIKVIAFGVITRIILSIVPGIIAMLIAAALFPSMDTLTKKIILLIATMPSAAISPFFTEYLTSNRQISSGILTFSTMFSVITIPFWYWMIENYGHYLF